MIMNGLPHQLVSQDAFTDAEIISFFRNKFAQVYPAIIYVYHPEGKKFIFLNDRAVSILGYDMKDPGSWDNDIENMIYHEDIKMFTSRIDDILQEERVTFYGFDCRYNDRNGNALYYKTKCIRINGYNNDSPKVLCIAEDINSVAPDYEKELEIKINELNRSNKELEEFAYLASHDLQEPLRKLITFSERLHSKCVEEGSEEVRMYAGRIIAASQNMRILIDNLLEFSRVSRAKDLYSEVDMNQVIKEVIEDMEPDIKKFSAEIVVSGLPVIQAVCSQMKQLFGNLFSNSIKFRSERGLQINISASNITPEERKEYALSRKKHYCKIIFEDNGIGFEPEYAEKIFNIFQRLHGKVEYPGSGIGLAICKKITDNHHGVIYANGIPEKGCKFTILLPESQEGEW